ncbi:uncharacterized protein LOC119374778 [Rhipicephalus sanguineus]|uniref:uncharacterized protein LOC119374778 n=1 Tax=Rhipicephalus sanguineus TaxID=34632 RepID=UPI00189303A0|nr:uncharacterized protein LOC119374778 [Rhipicephalus sanguineus]
MDKLIIAAIVLLLSKTYGAHSSGMGRTTTPSPLPNYDVKMFMNYTDGIWSVKSSTNHSFWCRVDTTANITGNTIYFNRSFIEGGKKWVHLPYKGDVQDNATDTMYVGLQGGPGVTTTEQLLFATQNYSCGVFQVTIVEGVAETSFPPQWFDLRVRNNSLSEIPKDCENKFKEFSHNSTIYQGYNDTCQVI